ncbi:MAG: hypothetical protein AAGD18_20245 [Actinomycetota bacterium]
MAETVTLPVRGWQRIRILAVFTAAGVTTAAIVGAVTGAALGPLPDPAPWAVAVAIGLTALADLVGPRALAVGRQVPLEWGRWFSPSTTAALYGARMGAGPLTILTSWTWWTATVLAGLHGPIVGAVAGTVFHIVRTLVMVAGVTKAADAPVRAAQLVRLDRPVWIGSAATTVAVAGLVLT